MPMKSQSEARLRSIGLRPARVGVPHELRLGLAGVLGADHHLAGLAGGDPLRALGGERHPDGRLLLARLDLGLLGELVGVCESKVEDLALILSLPFLRPLTLTLIAPFLRILAWLSLLSFSVAFFAAAPAGATTTIPTATNSIATTSFLIPVTNLLLCAFKRPCQAGLTRPPLAGRTLPSGLFNPLNAPRLR